MHVSSTHDFDTVTTQIQTFYATYWQTSKLENQKEAYKQYRNIYYLAVTARE